MHTLATAALATLGAYLALGIAFGIPFIIRGVDRVDPSMRISPVRMRILILPGVAALWPLLLVKWIRASRPAPAPRAPEPRS